MDIVDIEPSDPSDLPEPLAFHFDLAPTAWASELLVMSEQGRIDTPWASWHTDRRTVLAAHYNDESGLTVAAHLKRDGRAWSIIDAAVGLGGGARIGSSHDLVGLDAGLEECRSLASRFATMVDSIDALLAPWRTNARGSVTRRSEVAYAALAARYVELVNSGERHPGKALGQQLDMSPVTVAQRIREARGVPLGLLSPAVHGTAGGVLTDKAKALLVEATSTN